MKSGDDIQGIALEALKKSFRISIDSDTDVLIVLHI